MHLIGAHTQAVVLPEGEDLNEWLAVNSTSIYDTAELAAVDFFNQINMLYGCVTEFCTPTECPVMSAGPRYEYHWQDGVQYKKPTRLSAPDYVDALMNWVQGMLDDEAIFPSKVGVPFPRNFHQTIKSINRRLFRIYAHLYCHHFAVCAALSIEAHLNTSYRHYLLFVTEFKLIEEKELAPLAECVGCSCSRNARRLNESILAELAGH